MTNTTTNTTQVRTMSISTKGQMETAQRTGRPVATTDWQWAILAKTAHGVSFTCAYDNGSGWMYVGGVIHAESVADFNRHVDNFATNAVKGGSKVHEEGWK